MNSKNSGVAGSLGAVGLGLLAMLAAGCAETAEEAAQPAETTDKVETEIVAAGGWGINGCQGSGMYNVNSNAFQQWVAVDSSDFQNLNTSLSQVDAAGNQTAINQSAVAADEAFQSMINTFTNNINAAQQSSLIQSQNAATTGRWATTEAQNASTVQTVNNSSAAGSQNTVTEVVAQHNDRAAASNNAFANQNAYGSNVNSAFLGGPWLGGARSSFNNFAQGTNVASANNNLIANSMSDYQRTATHNDFAQAAHNDSLVASNSYARTALADTTSLTNYASQASQLAAYNQASAQTASNQATRAMSRATTYVFNNLSSYQMNRSLLNVQALARQSNQVLRVFAGNQFGVTGYSEFNLGFPACTGGAGVVGLGAGVGVGAVGVPVL